MPPTKTHIKKKLGQRGQSAVELALVATFVFLPMATLIIDGANLIYTHHRLSAAVREGARVASESLRPPPDILEGCSVNTGGGDNCAEGDNSTCCIAAARTNLVLFNTGLAASETRGSWVVRRVGANNLIFLRIEARTQVFFFFGLGNLVVEASATGFSDDVPA